MNQQRQQYRISIERTGRLTRQGELSECHVSDLTEQGFQIQTNIPLAMGEVVRLTCPLDLHTEVECGIAVTHARPQVFGTRIVDIAPEQQERLACFIQRLITLTMMGL